MHFLLIDVFFSRFNIESLEELTQLTVKLFSPVVNRGQDPAPLITTPPLGEKELGVRVFLTHADPFNNSVVF